MTENRRSTVGLKGHALYREGAACGPDGTPLAGRPAQGHAKCSCGALSPSLPSGMRRKQWHRDHKAETRAATS